MCIGSKILQDFGQNPGLHWKSDDIFAMKTVWKGKMATTQNSSGILDETRKFIKNLTMVQILEQESL